MKINVPFIMKFQDGEEITGYIIYDSENTSPRLLEVEHTREFNILSNLVDDGHYDDIHYVYADDEVTIIINPSSDFTDTLCKESPALLTEEDVPCNIKTTIGDAIRSIIDNRARCTRLNHNTIRCELAGDIVCWKICCGDVELTDAFEMSMKRFFW